MDVSLTLISNLCQTLEFRQEIGHSNDRNWLLINRFKKIERHSNQVMGP